MADKRQYSLQGAGRPKVSAATVQSECELERRNRVRGDQSDAVSSTPDRGKRGSDETRRGVACKVPRFQYVDFPSLHQCIQQLSVPPLESWLANYRSAGGCQGAASGLTQTSPKERVPKFKYVDYPSLYHCIQQLSVPPLETWSASLPQPPNSGRARGDGVEGGGGGRGVDGARVGVGRSTQMRTTRENQATQAMPSELPGEADGRSGRPGRTSLGNRQLPGHQSSAAAITPFNHPQPQHQPSTKPPSPAGQPLEAPNPEVQRDSIYDSGSPSLQPSLSSRPIPSPPRISTRPSVISVLPSRGLEATWQQQPLSPMRTASGQKQNTHCQGSIGSVSTHRSGDVGSVSTKQLGPVGSVCTQHSGPMGSVCALCQKTFETLEALRWHQEEHQHGH